VLNKTDAALVPVWDDTDRRDAQINKTIHTTAIKLRAFAACGKSNELD
jgi:hypothetical protein